MPNGDYELGYEPGAIENLINRIMGMEAPDPFMEKFYAGTGLSQGQIGDYITKMFSGAGAKRRAGEFEQRGLSDVNRLASQMFRKERLRSAATGGRGSSAEAALRARGGESLATARSGVRGQASQLEMALRDAMYKRGTGALGAWQGAARGDWQQAREYGDLMLDATSPLLGEQSLQMQDAWNQIKFWIEQQRMEYDYPVQED